MKRKIDTLRELMQAGDWRRAVAFAARFPRLGDARDAILDAHMAYTNPAFAQQVGKDPAALIAAGRTALVAAFRE